MAGTYFSPLLIGESSATRPCSTPKRCPRNFSPLLIGESSATAAIGRAGQRFHRDFSPLLIGESSATQSAPYHGAKPFDFSPLLIGESSATHQENPCTHACFLEFQSPPHRGIFCD